MSLLPFALVVLVVTVACNSAAATTDVIRQTHEKTHATSFRTKFETATRAGFAADVVLPSQARRSMAQSELRCFIQNDNTLACAFENTPRIGLTMVFFQCPQTSQSLLECDSCTIYEADNVEAVSEQGSSLDTCLSCDICVAESSVAYDCSAIDPDERCSKVDCEANCLNFDELSDGEDLTPGQPEDQSHAMQVSLLSAGVVVACLGVFMLY